MALAHSIRIASELSHSALVTPAKPSSKGWAMKQYAPPKLARKPYSELFTQADPLPNADGSQP